MQDEPETVSEPTQEPAATASEPAAEILSFEQKVEKAIDAWWAEHVPNSPLSRNTAVLNWFRSKLSELKTFIQKEIE